MKARFWFSLVLVILNLSFKNSAAFDRFEGLTTLVAAVTPEGSTHGTGFFYQEYSPKDPNKKGQPQWRAIQNVWVVTNRHVLLPKTRNKETVPASFTFHMREIVGDKLKWDPITLETQELLRRAKCHQNAIVDVCIISVLDLLMAKIDGKTNYAQWAAVGKDDLPGNDNKIAVQAGADIVVAGYPRSFYDETNLYPILKAGIIASKWGAHFNGRPHFLIDAKLFPGSSGSVVVSKPVDIVVSEGKVFMSKTKNLAFLGIFSAEPFNADQSLEFEDITIVRKLGVNVGVVWYGHVIEEIISKGQSPNELLR